MNLLSTFDVQIGTLYGRLRWRHWARRVEQALEGNANLN